jgi:hypothetical protein
MFRMRSKSHQCQPQWRGRCRVAARDFPVAGPVYLTTSRELSLKGRTAAAAYPPARERVTQAGSVAVTEYGHGSGSGSARNCRTPSRTRPGARRPRQPPPAAAARTTVAVTAVALENLNNSGCVACSQPVRVTATRKAPAGWHSPGHLKAARAREPPPAPRPSLQGFEPHRASLAQAQAVRPSPSHGPCCRVRVTS